MHPMLNIAIRIVRKVGAFIVQAYDSQPTIYNQKIHLCDIINKIINKSESMMMDMICKSYSNHIIITNKKKFFNFKNNTIYWIINSLNGKNNFNNKIPFFCISISVINNKQNEISVIYDPLQNELFTAVKGQGSKLNGYRIRCDNSLPISHSIVSVNNNFFNLKKINENNLYSQLISKLYSDGIRFRCISSFLLNLAYISAGRLQGLIHIDIKKIDFISGKLHLQESGISISDIPELIISNRENYSNILIGNAKIIKYFHDTFTYIFNKQNN
ncbi:inositol monophosphatase family protein [Buchnera aphidicola (Kurisakia onigurumii)]|uniref:inositol monophosphatase family protein n=1 Tax=Buchnera aphidicola TaxID=9 RepID=UPI0031B6E5B7